MIWDFCYIRDRVPLDVASGGGVVVLLKRALFAATLVFLATLGACERLTGHAVRDWSEDVLLDDGRTVTIDRHVEFDSSNSMAGDAYSSRESKSTMTFHDDLATLPPWNFPLVAMVLYQDPATSQWVVVATTSNCDTWSDWHEPQPMYWEFRSQGAGWNEAPISERSFGRKTNLFIGYEARLSTNHITVAMTAQYMAHTPVVERYRLVRSDALSNCPRSARSNSTNN
jgi:hypothetical protein